MLHVQAQQKPKQDSIAPIYIKNIRFETDVASLLANALYNGERYNYESAIVVDINRSYMPVLEFGFGGADYTSSALTSFKGEGIFSKIGLDFNLMKPEKDKPLSTNLFYAGVRFGLSAINYNYLNFKLKNDYWNEYQQNDYLDLKQTSVWFELVAGMRVEVSKNVYMGWTVRNKNIIGDPKPGEFHPWYVPGFGRKGEGNNWTINYAIGYKINMRN